MIEKWTKAIFWLTGVLIALTLVLVVLTALLVYFDGVQTEDAPPADRASYWQVLFTDALRMTSKNRLNQKMNMGKAYKQAIKRVFGEKYHDERMAVYWGRDDDSIHVIARLTHYVHKIAGANEDTLEFVSSAGDRIIVALTDEERRQI